MYYINPLLFFFTFARRRHVSSSVRPSGSSSNDGIPTIWRRRSPRRGSQQYGINPGWIMVDICWYVMIWIFNCQYEPLLLNVENNDSYWYWCYNVDMFLLIWNLIFIDVIVDIDDDDDDDDDGGYDPWLRMDHGQCWTDDEWWSPIFNEPNLSTSQRDQKMTPILLGRALMRTHCEQVHLLWH